MSKKNSNKMDCRKLTIYKQYIGNKSVPPIKLQGRCLENLGFRIGESIEICPHSEKREILIKLKEVEGT